MMKMRSLSYFRTRVFWKQVKNLWRKSKKKNCRFGCFQNIKKNIFSTILKWTLKTQNSKWIQNTKYKTEIQREQMFLSIFLFQLLRLCIKNSQPVLIITFIYFFCLILLINKSCILWQFSFNKSIRKITIIYNSFLK